MLPADRGASGSEGPGPVGPTAAAPAPTEHPPPPEAVPQATAAGADPLAATMELPPHPAAPPASGPPMYGPAPSAAPASVPPAYGGPPVSSPPGYGPPAYGAPPAAGPPVSGPPGYEALMYGPPTYGGPPAPDPGPYGPPGYRPAPGGPPSGYVPAAPQSWPPVSAQAGAPGPPAPGQPGLPAPGQPGAPYAGPRPPRVPFWRRPRLLVPLLVVVALVAGLLVWSPWIAPAPPTQVRATSQSATSVALQWGSSDGHTGPGKYAILRDGATIATVSSDQTSYVDQGLRPGQSYAYSVVAQSWLRHSAPAAGDSVRTLAPSPGRPTRGEVATNSAAVHWTAPANSPAPDGYEVLRDGNMVKAVEHTTTVYQDSGLTPGTSYRYQVVARWGENRSVPSAPLAVRTVTPPLAAARLTGSSVPVKFVITHLGDFTNVHTGARWTDYWTLTPRCSSGACDVQLAGNFTPPDIHTATFTMHLTRRGTAYGGTTTLHLTKCGTISETDTLTVRLAVRSAGPEGTEWVARTWAGTVTVISPFTEAGGGFFCSGARIDANIAS